MNSNSNFSSPVLRIFAAATFVLLAQMSLSAQLPVKEQSTAPSVTSQPQTQVQTASEEAIAPVYGLQGVLIETLDGKVVSAQGVDQAFNPASSIKLATALVALRNFGPNHRFSTGFWTDGSLDTATGQITGNLYVTGRDPSFHHEHAVMIARQLNSLGIRSVTGDLIVAPGFTMDFNSSARTSGESLYDTLDATRRPSEATRAWNYE